MEKKTQTAQWPEATALLKAINSDMGMYPNGLSLLTTVCPVCFNFYEKHLFSSGEVFNCCHETEIDETGMVGEGVFLFCTSILSANV